MERMDKEERVGGREGGRPVEGEGRAEGAESENQYSRVCGLTLCCHGD